MIKNGTKPTPLSHKDYDFHKTFGTVGTIPVFPPEYNTDSGLWMPDQNAPEPIFGNPAMDNGCTDYCQADISADIDNILKNPAIIEALDHANALGGIDIRTALMAAVKLGWIQNFYNIQAYAPLDYFDAIRYAMIAGVPERRSVSWGTPWYREWESASQLKTSIMSAPHTFDPTGLSWHNSKIAGWKVINGITYLVNKSWQGKGIGDNGWLYFDRATVNSTMAVRGTVAYTSTEMSLDGPIHTIDTTLLQWLMSFIRNMLSLQY